MGEGVLVGTGKVTHSKPNLHDLMALEETLHRKVTYQADPLTLWGLCTGMRVDNGCSY